MHPAFWMVQTESIKQTTCHLIEHAPLKWASQVCAAAQQNLCHEGSWIPKTLLTVRYTKMTMMTTLFHAHLQALGFS